YDLPLPPAAAHALLQPVTDTTALALTRKLVAGAYAAEVGQWDAHARAVEDLRAPAPGSDRAGHEAQVHAMALAAFGDARRGQARRGLAGLQRVLTPPGDCRLDLLKEQVRWWLGTLYAEEDHLEEARRYFPAFAGEPYGRLAMARIHER